MLLKRPGVALIGLLFAGAVDGQQPAPTPPEQHVVAPSLPDQKNKEGTVRPSGAMQTDAAGWVVNAPAPASPKAAAPAARGRPAGTPAPAGPGSFPTPPPSGSGGPPVVKAAHVTLRGTMKAYEPGTSVTIVEANGRERTVPLAPKASVYEGARPGDKVSIRIPLGSPGEGKAADRVDRQKKTEPPKSKFSKAQAPPD